MLLSVHLLPVPAVVRDHDRTDTRFNRGDVRRQEQPSEGGFIADGVPLIDAVLRATVSNEMFGATEDIPASGQALLKPSYGGGPQLRDQLRAFTIAFISPPPSLVLSDSDTRSKCPLNGSAGNLFSNHARSLLHQGRIPGGSETNVLREQHSAIDIVVTVHGVDAVHQWDFESRLEGPR